MLLQGQRDQDAHQGGPEAQNPVSEFLRSGAVTPAQPGKNQDHREFGDLRGLKLDPRDGHPSLGSVDALPHHQHRQQKGDANEVDVPRIAAPELRGHTAEQDHAAQSQNGADGLLLQISGGDGVIGIILALGKARRPEHGKSQRQKHQHQDQKHRVHGIGPFQNGVLIGAEPRFIQCRTFPAFASGKLKVES